MSSDEDCGVFPAAHKKLLSEINEIVKFQHVKKPVRNEPAVKNSEFHLVKSKSSENDDEEQPGKISKKSVKVSISSVAQTVQKNTKQKQIGKQLKNAFKSNNVLPKPLEKVYADRIQRTIAYDNTKTKLGRWDAVVTKNQNASQVKFPLVLEKTKMKSKDPESLKFRYKTQLMKDVEAIHNECFPEPLKEIDTPSNAPELLTLEEMKERRKELGRLKLKESHKIVKQRMQGKIKSKKYHKLKKREELKKKMKEFEELKVTNPEAALKELEKIEKQRVQERTTLRHKNTGTWAKNLQVRAKYDANVKQDLEAQLALGRELTQKAHQSDSSESEDEEERVIVKVESENPWLGLNKPSDPLDEVFSGYRKFWEEHNVNEKQAKKIKQDVMQAKVAPIKPVAEDSLVESSSGEQSEEDSESESSENEDTTKFINDLFDEAEEKISSKIETRLTELKPNFLQESKERKGKRGHKKQASNVHEANYLSFAKKTKLGDIDEALHEGHNDDDFETSTRSSKHLLKEIKQMKEKKTRFMKGSEEIDPESFISVKSKHLITAIPKSQDFGEIDDEFQVEQLSKANKMSLAEAFENDDIVNDFEEEIESDFKKNSTTEDVNVAGWGSWGGHGVRARKPEETRKKIPNVKKKDRIIISSAPNEKLQKHLISSVPFPFKSVQDFEASMRLPIGRDFIPESAHQKLTLPSVVTKAGTIIEPMSEDILVQNNAPLKNKFVKRGKKIVGGRGRKVKK